MSEVRLILLTIFFPLDLQVIISLKEMWLFRSLNSVVFCLKQKCGHTFPQQGILAEIHVFVNFTGNNFTSETEASDRSVGAANIICDVRFCRHSVFETR